MVEYNDRESWHNNHRETKTVGGGEIEEEERQKNKVKYASIPNGHSLSVFEDTKSHLDLTKKK